MYNSLPISITEQFNITVLLTAYTILSIIALTYVLFIMDDMYYHMKKLGTVATVIMLSLPLIERILLMYYSYGRIEEKKGFVSRITSLLF